MTYADEMKLCVQEEGETNLGETQWSCSVPRGINGDAVSLRHREMSMLMVLPKSLSFFELVHDPAVLEGALPSCI